MSGIILPGKFPVDPDDPTKGNLTPVLKAPELTAGLMNLGRQVESLAQFALVQREQTGQLAYQLSDMIANLVRVVRFLVDDLDIELFTDPDDEAYQALLKFQEDHEQFVKDMLAAQEDTNEDEEEVKG